MRRRAFFTPQSVVLPLAFAASFFSLAVVGPRLDVRGIASTYVLMNTVGVVNLALLAVLLWFYDAARLRVVLVLLLATATAVMPASFLFAGNALSFALVKLATFFAFVLTLLHVADGVRPGADFCPSVRGVLFFLSALAALTAAASLAGEAAARTFAGDALGASFASVVLLYVVLVVFVLITTFGKDKVLHVITGSFNDESEIARVRLDVLCQQHPDLSPRERDVLVLLLQGYSTPRIAERLSISENTAKTHLRHVYAKLGVRSRQQVMAVAERVELRTGERPSR